MKRILVTGGAGLIGSHLCEQLVQEGHFVEALDNLSTGDVQNLDAVAVADNFRFHEGSAGEPKTVGPLVERADVVVHLAAAVGVRLIVENLVQTLHTNIRTTEVVLEAVARAKKKILLASTSEVYGRGEQVPFSEDDDLKLGPPHQARWSYACSKALGEWLAMAYHRERDVPVVVCRFFNVVGPRQVGRYGMVLPNFIQQAIRGDPITVFGSGTQTRCFAHVKDVAATVARLLEAPEAIGEIINVGSDEEIEIRALAERVREQAGSSSPIECIPYTIAYGCAVEDMLRRRPDLTKLRRILGTLPGTSLDSIIQDTLAYQIQFLGRE